MQIEHISSRITDGPYDTEFHPDWEKSPKLEMTFSGAAPYAYMQTNKYRNATMSCIFIRNNKRVKSYSATAMVFFTKVIEPKSPRTTMYSKFGKEVLLYNAYTFSNFTVEGISNNPPFELLEETWNRTECFLKGHKSIFGPFVESNPITITKEKFLELYENYSNQ